MCGCCGRQTPSPRLSVLSHDTSTADKSISPFAGQRHRQAGARGGRGFSSRKTGSFTDGGLQVPHSEKTLNTDLTAEE